MDKGNRWGNRLRIYKYVNITKTKSDFLIKKEDNLIPVEVGIGKKTKGQLTIAMNKYKSEYGILISDRTAKIRYENNILYIPLITFALI